ncbi:MAG: rRNA (pseudouridine1915-N3)-methyltransferase [Acidobacteriota bacterium]|jgi:23S rRNA (pseudouridine1915-N3)-methyltransferase|nr:rRNA (pseudouridine1915-N3)-methyltransferase [Acidobacteriota bacterium]MDT5261400.1 rRNA (pseudouridine1915-N3)-methyltransferase [Acidobacteriota bacterium]MDT7781114.1 rRNA (pseudouridine1915-N3)-methyltransferase [Acidobacteriota bacterium]
MRLRLIWIGKTRNEHLRALADEYLKRLTRFARCEVMELRESAAADERACLEEEGKRIVGTLASDALAVLLDVGGPTRWSSEELAAQIEEWQGRSVKEVAFVVGGHLGVSGEVRKRADVRWSLSRLTLTHEMARVVLAEQLYRAYTITRGLPYQK